MNRREFLGEFEELVLLIVAALQPEAYGKTILDEIQTEVDREVGLSAIHTTLYRLEDKGLLISHVGGASNERGGRRKRYFEITNQGLSSLRTLREMRLKLWHKVGRLK